MERDKEDNVKLELNNTLSKNLSAETEDLGKEIIKFLISKNPKLTVASMALSYAKNNINNYAVIK